MKRAALVICWVSLLFVCQVGVAAASSPITRGQVLLCSDEVPGREVIDKFISLTNSVTPSITVLSLAPVADQHAQPDLALLIKKSFEKFNPALKIINVSWQPDMAGNNLEPLKSSQAVWIISSSLESSLLAAKSEELKRTLRSFQSRSGIIGASGNAATLLAETMFVERKASPAGDSAKRFQSMSAIRAGLLESVAGFKAVDGLVVDRNSIKGSRLNHLVNMVLQNPQLTVLGIDDNGAVWIKPDGDIEVIGEGNVVVLSAAHARITTVRDATAQPAYLSAEGIQLHLLLPGGIYNLPAHKVRATGEQAVRGHLILLGGGAGFPADALAKFLELVGSPEQLILVFSVGLDDKERQHQEYELIKELFVKKGYKNVQGVFIDSPKDAEKAELVELVRQARGIVFGGGDQRRITRVLQGTPVEKALWKVYTEGAVISGGSAGAAIQGQLMITGEGKTLAEDKNLPSPFHTIRTGNVELTPGMGFFPKAIIDQHFIARARSNRLLSTILEHPDLIGVGIDAGAAVWLKPDRTFQVMGDSSVMVINPGGAQIGLGDAIEGGAGERRVAASNLSVTLLSPGDRFDLSTKQLMRPASPPAARQVNRKNHHVGGSSIKFIGPSSHAVLYHAPVTHSQH